MNRNFLSLWLPVFAALATGLTLCSVYGGEAQQPMEWAAKIFATAVVAAWSYRKRGRNQKYREKDLGNAG